MRTLLITALALAGASAPLGAQSVFGSRGLGVPLAPVDARARALGGIGIGLFEFNPGFINPAETAGVTRRGIVSVMQPTRRNFEFEGETDRVDSTRFPMLRVLYPVGSRTVVSAGYGGFLDQNWAVETEGAEVIGDRAVPTRDVLRSTGGLSQIQVGAAYRLSNALAVGVAGGLYTGHLRQQLTRTFTDPEGEPFVPFLQTREWDYRAPMLSAGLRWDPAPVLRLAGAVTWAGELRITNDEQPERRVDLPLQLAGGISGHITPELMANVSGRWSGWSDAGDDFEGGTADTWEWGAGLEWTGITAAGRVFPVRIGHGRASLPFLFDGEQPREQATALGIGARFGGTPALPMARLDGTVERGTRGDEARFGLSERFWRATVSLSLFGL